MLIGGSGGSEPSYVAELLASEGVTALSVAYFARPGLPAQLRDIPLEYFRGALRMLIGALPSPTAPIMVLGMSRGSEAALLSAIHFRDLVDGVILTVPGNIVAGSWPPGRPAWLLDSHPLPHVDHAGPACDNPDAMIPVELVRGPILLIAAGADQVWPSAAMSEAIAHRLRANRHPFGDQLLKYPDAGHSLGYLIPALPAELLHADITDEDPDKVARADAWPKSLQFARECLERQ